MVPILLLLMCIILVEGRNPALPPSYLKTTLLETKYFPQNDPLPERYDSITDPGNPKECQLIMTTRPKESYGCGDCYALAVAQVASISMCRNSKGKHNKYYSARHLAYFSTPREANSCDGGREGNAIELLKDGVPSGSPTSANLFGCQPYNRPMCDPNKPKVEGEICAAPGKKHFFGGVVSSQICDDGTKVQRLEKARGTIIEPPTVQNIKEAILANGAVTTGFCFAPVAKGYKGEIIKGKKYAKDCIDKVKKEKVRDHVATITGWDKEVKTGKEFWRIQNTYADLWSKSTNGYLYVYIEEDGDPLNCQSEVRRIDWIQTLFTQRVVAMQKYTKEDQVYHCFTDKIYACMPGYKVEIETVEDSEVACWPEGQFDPSYFENVSLNETMEENPYIATVLQFSSVYKCKI